MFSDAFVHAPALHLCPHCGTPDLPGVSCLCSDHTSAGLSCSTCGASPGDYEATCPECRKEGRVDMSLVSFLERAIDSYDHLPPPDELLAEEPLPTIEPPRSRRSWRPAAA